MPLYRGKQPVISNGFYSAGSFELQVPLNISYVRFICIGGGQGGQGGGGSTSGGGSNYGGAGGAGGWYSEITFNRRFIDDTITATVGAGSFGGSKGFGTTGTIASPGGTSRVRGGTLAGAGWTYCYAPGGGATSPGITGFPSMPNMAGFGGGLLISGGGGGQGGNISGPGGQAPTQVIIYGAAGGGGGGSHSAGTSFNGGLGGYGSSFGLGSTVQASQGANGQEYSFNGVIVPIGGNGGGGANTVNFVGSIAGQGAPPGGGGGGGSGSRSGTGTGGDGARGCVVIEFIK